MDKKLSLSNFLLLAKLMHVKTELEHRQVDGAPLYKFPPDYYALRAITYLLVCSQLLAAQWHE